MTLQWVSSEGGPLIMIDAADADVWRGIDGDYETACAVPHRLGVLECHGRSIVVLGDEPSMTGAWYGSAPLILVRWVYARDEHSIVGMLEQGVPGRCVESTVWHAASGQYLVFDAAMTAREARDSGEYLSIELPRGAYRIETHLLEKPGDASVVLHVFEADPRRATRAGGGAARSTMTSRAPWPEEAARCFEQATALRDQERFVEARAAARAALAALLPHHTRARAGIVRELG